MMNAGSRSKFKNETDTHHGRRLGLLVDERLRGDFFTESGVCREMIVAALAPPEQVEFLSFKCESTFQVVCHDWQFGRKKTTFYISPNRFSSLLKPPRSTEQKGAVCATIEYWCEVLWILSTAPIDPDDLNASQEQRLLTPEKTIFVVRSVDRKKTLGEKLLSRNLLPGKGWIFVPVIGEFEVHDAEGLESSRQRAQAEAEKAFHARLKQIAGQYDFSGWVVLYASELKVLQHFSDLEEAEFCAQRDGGRILILDCENLSTVERYWNR